ncbi:MAG: hypothetical protein JWR14_7303 [Caballeronia sp.]|jgi:hypothetical protein|nr:hypothetical protein [Caballeronia sp.]
MGFSRDNATNEATNEAINNATNEATTKQKQATNQGPKQPAPSKLNQAGSSLKHDVARLQDNRTGHRKKSGKACDAIIAGILN